MSTGCTVNGRCGAFGIVDTVFFVCGEWTSGAYLNCVIREISCSALLSAADLEQSSGICGSKECSCQGPHVMQNSVYSCFLTAICKERVLKYTVMGVNTP